MILHQPDWIKNRIAGCWVWIKISIQRILQFFKNLFIMKKYLFVASVITLFAACGGSNSDKKNETGKKENTGKDLSQNPDYKAGLALISQPDKLCLTCHKIDEKLTGPAYRDVANKYENTDANVKMLAEKVVKGGVGVWGEVIMPPNSNVTLEEAETIVKYILLLKK